MTSLPPPLRFVLMRPRSSANLGSAARALKNFGLRNWTWVDAWAEGDGDARRLAVHAEELLAQARAEPDLRSAVADCVWVVGTSSRPVPGKPSLSPRAFAREALARAATGPVALVFGDERSGLRRDELDQCHALSTIPTDASQPSVNLAQSVLLYAYEFHLAVKAASSPSPGATPRPPTDAALRHLEETLVDALTRSGFLHAKGRHAERDLIDTLRRGAVTAKDVALWTSALHVLAHGRGQPRGPR